MICYCQPGYSGAKCDACDDNFYGNPDKPGGTCQECNCNNNIELSRSGNCDARTGKCLQCLYETDGDNCEYCKDGFYGDALRQDCRSKFFLIVSLFLFIHPPTLPSLACDCDVLGTNGTIKHCDRYTGQCPCLPNVSGTRCDECAKNHWKIASGEGCEACNCDEIGARSEQCNPVREFEIIFKSNLKPWVNFFKKKVFKFSIFFSTMGNASADKVSEAVLAINVKRISGVIRTLSAKVNLINSQSSRIILTL